MTYYVKIRSKDRRFLCDDYNKMVAGEGEQVLTVDGNKPDNFQKTHFVDTDLSVKERKVDPVTKETEAERATRLANEKAAKEAKKSDWHDAVARLKASANADTQDLLKVLDIG